MIVRVAAGVLRRPDGQILIAQRPAGKIAAGRWEFPGGKIESGESADQALQRELLEELGTRASRLRPLIRIRHAYTERTVELDTWLVEDWAGEPQGLEGQNLAWTDPVRIWDYDLLEADAPIVNALRLPEILPVTGRFTGIDELLTRCLQLVDDGHGLFRLRAPDLDDAQYAGCVRALGSVLVERGAQMLVDREDCVQALGVAGLQLTSERLQRQRGRPVDNGQWLLASCHDERDLDQAIALDVDAIVVGAVRATASHPGRQPLGWNHFARLAALANRPAYAIGGLSSEDLEQAQGCGGQGIAAISAYW